MSSVTSKLIELGANGPAVARHVPVMPTPERANMSGWGAQTVVLYAWTFPESYW